MSEVIAIQKNGKKIMMAPQATARVMSQRTWTSPMVTVAREEGSLDAAMELMSCPTPDAISSQETPCASAVLQYSTGFRKIRHCSKVTTRSVMNTNTAMTEASPNRKNLKAVSYSSMMTV